MNKIAIGSFHINTTVAIDLLASFGIAQGRLVYAFRVARLCGLNRSGCDDIYMLFSYNYVRCIKLAAQFT